MSGVTEQGSDHTAAEHAAAEQAHPDPQLLRTSDASPKAAPPQGGPSFLGWIASKAMSVGGACLHVISGPGAGTLIFTSVCLVMTYQKRKASLSSRRAERKPQQAAMPRSISFAMLQGGRRAMERFRAFHNVGEPSKSAMTKSPSAALEYIRRELESDKKDANLQNKQLDFVELYAQIGILELSRMETEAIEVLEKALEKSKGPYTHNAHEIELLLVELLIYKGEYDKALAKTCLSGGDNVAPRADARVPLYKTIIHCIKANEEEAKRNYNEFKSIRDEYHLPKLDRPVFLEVIDFEAFKQIANCIKEEIEPAQRTADCSVAGSGTTSGATGGQSAGQQAGKPAGQSMEQPQPVAQTKVAAAAQASQTPAEIKNKENTMPA